MVKLIELGDNWYTKKITDKVCAKSIKVKAVNGIVKDVITVGGCPGNAAAIRILIRDMPIKEVIKKLADVKCGNKPSSCAAQIAAICMLIDIKTTEESNNIENIYAHSISVVNPSNQQFDFDKEYRFYSEDIEGFDGTCKVFQNLIKSKPSLIPSMNPFAPDTSISGYNILCRIDYSTILVEPECIRYYINNKEIVAEYDSEKNMFKIKFKDKPKYMVPTDANSFYVGESTPISIKSFIKDIPSCKMIRLLIKSRNVNFIECTVEDDDVLLKKLLKQNALIAYSTDNATVYKMKIKEE